MNIKEWDFCELSFGDLSVMVYYNGDVIESFNAPAYIPEDKHRDTVNTREYYFEFDDVNFSIEIMSSNVGVFISLSTDEDDSHINYTLFDISLQREYEGDDDSIVKKESIEVYVPALSYTQTTGALLYGFEEEYYNTKLIPLLDVDNIDRFDIYKSDPLLEYKHFLDLWEMRDVSNKDARDEVKQLQENGTKKKMPAKTFEIEPLSQNEILANYNDVNFAHVIPIIPIKNNSQDFTNILLAFKEKFSKIALRISAIRDFTNSLKMISNQLFNYYDPANIYVIFDVNTNYDIDGLGRIIGETQIFFKEENFVYLGANFNTTGLSIPRDQCNRNHYTLNSTLSTYFELLKAYPSLAYGDYCGFDRKTVTRARGKPTARVVLSSLSGMDEIIIRRGFDPKDINTENPKIQGYRHSMIRLLGDLEGGAIRRRYLDEDLCDADDALKSYGPVSTTPGKIKTLCLRHNIFSIIHRFISKNQIEPDMEAPTAE